MIFLEQVQKVPGVIKLLDFYELRDEFIFVFERPSPCIDLSKFIKKSVCLAEELTRNFFHQIVGTVKSCHEQGIVHRDIKAENILVDIKNQKLKLIDFGCSAFIKEGDYTDFGGTPAYSAPEWFTNDAYQGEPFTVWSLGILLYFMSFGDFPFDTNEEAAFDEVEFWGDVWSDLCQDVIRRCLEKRPEDRITLEQLLEHEFVKRACFPDENTFSINPTILNVNIDSDSAISNMFSSDLENENSTKESISVMFSSD